jgi:hypothetical protein
MLVTVVAIAQPTFPTTNLPCTQSQAAYPTINTWVYAAPLLINFTYVRPCSCHTGLA